MMMMYLWRWPRWRWQLLILSEYWFTVARGPTAHWNWPSTFFETIWSAFLITKMMMLLLLMMMMLIVMTLLAGKHCMILYLNTGFTVTRDATAHWNVLSSFCRAIWSVALINTMLMLLLLVTTSLPIHSCWPYCWPLLITCCCSCCCCCWF